MLQNWNEKNGFKLLAHKRYPLTFLWDIMETVPRITSFLQGIVYLNSNITNKHKFYMVPCSMLTDSFVYWYISSFALQVVDIMIAGGFNIEMFYQSNLILAWCKAFYSSVFLWLFFLLFILSFKECKILWKIKRFNFCYDNKPIAFNISSDIWKHLIGQVYNISYWIFFFCYLAWQSF